MLIGEYKMKLDAKGRLKLPNDLIIQMPTFFNDNDKTTYSFIVKISNNGCILLYPFKVWERKLKQLEENISNPEKLTVKKRQLFMGSCRVFLSSYDTILIPTIHIEHADFKKNCRLIGMADHIEIWSEEKYENIE